MKKTMVILSLFIIILLASNVTDDLIIPDNSIRVRVVANSNSSSDQLIKQMVKNKLEEDITNLLSEAKNINDARRIIEDNIELINISVKTALQENGYDTDYEVDFGYNLFPEKKYKGVVYKEGYYESVVVTLGKGEGNNWWCVLFPPLCLMETDESNLEEIEYKSFIKEIIDKYF
ncbi:MAG: stage II sporulation protein R [Bacilli bacterium]|nr:stage II sporulation protein R [Bacilli bacterium]